MTKHLWGKKFYHKKKKQFYNALGLFIYKNVEKMQ